jgi:uncharacterized cupredoxin-like copper-binding protein
MYASRTHLSLTALALLSGAALVVGLPAARANSDGMAQMTMAGDTHHHGDATGFTFGAPVPAAEATCTIKITMADIAFQPAAIAVRSRETLRLGVTNSSGVDHEFTLGDAATEQAHHRETAEMM